MSSSPYIPSTLYLATSWSLLSNFLSLVNVTTFSWLSSTQTKTFYLTLTSFLLHSSVTNSYEILASISRIGMPVDNNDLNRSFLNGLQPLYSYFFHILILSLPTRDFLEFSLKQGLGLVMGLSHCSLLLSALFLQGLHGI